MLRHFRRPSLAITLILAAAFGSVVFSLCAGTFVYENTKALIEAEQWVEHSQEVLSALQGASQKLDRVEANMQLFAVTHKEENLIAARAAAVSLGTTGVHIRSLVFDNSSQIAEITSLGICAQTIAKELERSGSGDAAPVTPILRCRQILSRMSEQERQLLRTRTEASF